MSEILTIEGMKDSTAAKIMKYKMEGFDIGEISRKTRVGIEKIDKVVELNSVEPEASDKVRENEQGNQTILEADNNELTIEKEIEMEENELTPDQIVTEGVDSEAGEIIKMKPQTANAGKAKEKKSPKLEQKIISMSNLPGKGRKR